MSQQGPFTGSKFRKAIRIFLFGRAAQAAGTLVLTLLVVRALSPSDYGAYMTLWGLVEIAVPLSALGLLQAVQRFLPELASHGTPQGLRAFVRWVSVVRLTMLLLFAGLLAWQWPVLSGWLGFDADQQGQSSIAVMLVVTVLGLRFVAEMLESLLEQGYAQVVRALEPLGRLTGVALLMLGGQVSLLSVFWVDLLVSGLCLVLAEVFLVRQMGRLKPSGTHVIRLREIATFAWYNTGYQVMIAASGIGTQRLIVARLLGLEAAGMFAFLQQLLNTVGRYLPGTLFANTIRPMLISRHAMGEVDTVRTGIGMLLKGNLIVVAVAFLVVFSAGDALVNLASGGRYRDAGLIAALMLIAVGGVAQGQVIAMVMQIYHYTRQMRNFALLALLAPFMIWLGTRYGLTGVAVSQVAVAWLRNGMTMAWLQRQPLTVAMDWRGISSVAGVALVALVVLWGGSLIALPLGPWAMAALVAILYVAGLCVIPPLTVSEHHLLQRALGARALHLAAWVRKGGANG